MVKRQMIWGFTLGLLLSCCGQAIATFSYRYYNLKAERYSGQLQGPTEQDDLDLSVCEPRPGKQNPCTVMLTPEFQRLKTDKQKVDTDLKACLDNQN